MNSYTCPLCSSKLIPHKGKEYYWCSTHGDFSKRELEDGIISKGGGVGNNTKPPIDIKGKKGGH